VTPLEKLFALEIEYHRLLRAASVDSADTAAVHTSYALQSGYEPLMRSVGYVTNGDIERLMTRFALACDARDVLNARDSLTNLFGVRPIDDR
jgi:hypothetical protein